MFTIKKKIYPSSAGFMVAGRVITDYNSACLRYMLAKAAGFRDKDIAPELLEMAERDEDDFELKLMTEGKAAAWFREEAFKQEVPGTGVVISGRKDFIVYYPGLDSPVIIEKKSTMSKSSIYGNIRKNTHKTNHLAQCLLYMLHEGTPYGFIAMCGYKRKKDRKTKEEMVVRSFHRDTKEIDSVMLKVEILPNNKIAVEGRDTEFEVEDLVNWVSAAASVLENPRLEDRPLTDPDAFYGPCKYCPLSSVCDKHDEQRLTVDEFIDQSLTIAKELQK